MKKLFQNLLLIFASLLLFLGFLEILLGFLPVTEVTRTLPLKADSDPFEVSAKPNSKITFSHEFNFLNSRTRKTNNYGFFSDYDFKESAEVNLVIGDSYVEASQVNFEDTFHQITAKNLSSDFYPIGISGNPLSQYEAYFMQACETFKINKLIFTIISNDFDESLSDHKIRNGFFHYYDDGDSAKLKATPYKMGKVRKLANSSNLIRYVYFNLNAGSKIRRFITGAGQTGNNENQSNSNSKDSKTLSANLRAIDIFLGRIGNYCLGKDDIFFLVDAARNKIYGGETSSVFLASRKHFIDSAREMGYTAIDLEPFFVESYNKDQSRFEFEFNGHWNKLGHRVAAEALTDYLKE